MSVRQYIGARYVTKIYQNSLDPSSAEWEQGTFEPLVMVTWQNSTYLSKKQVPGSVGDPANNPDYWVCTGYYNGQILSLQNQINDIKMVSDTIITPQMFGAVGDGVTNDTQAFIDAIADGRPIFVSDGTYLITSSLVIPDDKQVVIIGSGNKNANIKFTGALDSILFDVRGTFSTRKYLILRDLMLTGTGVEIGISGEYNSDGLLIQNTHIDGFKIGINGDHQWNHSYINVTAVNCTTGIQLANSNAINIINTITSGCVTGIALSTCRDIIVNGGDVSGINGNTSTGIDASYVDGLSVVSVYSEYSNTAYKLASCTGVSITGCLIFVYDDNAKCIDISSCGAVHIAGNKIEPVNSPVNVRGIGVKDSTSVTIESNSVINVETGIYLYNARYIIGSNVFTGTTNPLVLYDHAYARGYINMLLTDYVNSTVPAAPIPYNEFHFEDVPNFVGDLDDLPADVPGSPLFPYGYCISAYVGGVLKPVYRVYGGWVYADGTSAHTD